MKLKIYAATMSLLISINAFAAQDTLLPIFKSRSGNVTKTLALECNNQNNGKCEEYSVVNITKDNKDLIKDTINTIAAKDLPAFAQNLKHIYKWNAQGYLLVGGPVAGLLCAILCRDTPVLRAMALPVGVAFDIVKAPIAVPYFLGRELHHAAELAKLNHLLHKLVKAKAAHPVVVSPDRYASMLSSFRE